MNGAFPRGPLDQQHFTGGSLPAPTSGFLASESTKDFSQGKRMVGPTESTC